MKRLLLKVRFVMVLVFIVSSFFSQAQVRTKIFREAKLKELFPAFKPVSREITLSPSSEFRKLLIRPTDAFDNRFAVSLPVNINFTEQAEVSEYDNYKTYSLRITAKEALNISLEFGSFNLSENAILSIYTDNELTDSITSKENNVGNIWATRVYQGRSLNIIFKEIINEKKSVLNISKVNFGYKKYGIQYGSPGASASCEINVNCTLGNGWDNEKNSVALVVANGEEWCSGSLVMNTCNTNIPYLLTADHCLDAGNVTAWVFQFQYWSTTCSTNSGWSEDIQFNGCILRANSEDTDFALLQLNNTPPANSGIHYAGWSRNTTGITETTIIHHPAGDLMKITRDDDAPTTASFLGADCWHLNVDDGTTEGGSSGAPYFDQNHRIIGQHYGIDDGNLAICNQVSKYGGRFDLSWTGGGTNATRLSNWLDPSGSDATTTNTTNVSSLEKDPNTLYISGLSSLCSGTSSAYTIPDLPAGATVAWSATPGGIVTINSPTATQTTITMIGNATVQLTAAITLCGSMVNKGIAVAVGVPEPVESLTIDTVDPQTSEICHASSSMLVAYPGVIEANTTYEWSLPGDWTAYETGTSSATTQDYMLAVYPGTDGWLYVRRQNQCGYSSFYSALVTFDPWCSSFRISPNPAKDNITIDGQKKNIREVQIVDKTGQLKRVFKFGGNMQRVNLNISGLAPDIYYIRIFDGKAWKSKPVVIAR